MSAAGDRVWSVLDLLRWTTDHFASRGIETARLDAEVLLAYALETQRLHLYIDYEKPVGVAERGRFRELVKRRADERVPVAHLVGAREFWSLRLRVTPDVLVPRPETETLVSAVLDLRPDAEAELRILDVGTGSGALALALAVERPKAQVLATDVSAAALAVAGENAESLGLADRVAFALGDLFEPARDACFDVIVANPPYLAEAEAATRAPELAHEPKQALYAGPEGSEVLLRLVSVVPDRLEPGGLLALEIDPRQAQAVSDACIAVGLTCVKIWRDLAGRQRVVTASSEGG